MRSFWNEMMEIAREDAVLLFKALKVVMEFTIAVLYGLNQARKENTFSFGIGVGVTIPIGCIMLWVIGSILLDAIKGWLR